MRLRHRTAEVDGKPVEVEAWQFERWDARPIPGWILRGTSQLVTDPGAVRGVALENTRREDLPRSMQLTTAKLHRNKRHYRQRALSDGDWILRSADGTLSVQSQRSIERNFEPVTCDL